MTTFTDEQVERLARELIDNHVRNQMEGIADNAGGWKILARHVLQREQRLREALEFYAKHIHWMSPTENGDRNLLIAHGPNFNGTSNGWVEAGAALANKTGEERGK